MREKTKENTKKSNTDGREERAESAYHVLPQIFAQRRKASVMTKKAWFAPHQTSFHVQHLQSNVRLETWNSVKHIAGHEHLLQLHTGFEAREFYELVVCHVDRHQIRHRTKRPIRDRRPPDTFHVEIHKLRAYLERRV